MHFATSVKCALYSKRYGFDAHSLNKIPARAPNPSNFEHAVTAASGGCC